MSAVWKQNPFPARLGEALGDRLVCCHLSPRNCKIRPGQAGFCGVRANVDGHLMSLNYGRSVHATEETIETEAVYHFAPGAPILSMGNIGCMLNCDYCHNWKTSQAKFVDDKDVYYYTPQEVVDIALRHGIRVLSWTYNDPVVWHEFVVETATLAKEYGLINLYKSAFFISERAIEELIPVIDIFSISIKSMDREYYRKITKGWLEPVLEGTKQVYRAGKHVEVSTLMVTDISDDEKTARDLATFVGEHLGPEVPTHFVRFHPDYKMINTIRTPVDRLEHARRVAVGMGLHHVYLGNVYDTESTSTWCRSCNHLQVTRYGLNARLVGLDDNGRCVNCGTDANFKLLGTERQRQGATVLPVVDGLSEAHFHWHGDVRAAHIRVLNRDTTLATIYHGRISAGGEVDAWEMIELSPGESFRFIAAKSSQDELGIKVAVPSSCTSNLHEVFDRAHFPTIEIADHPTDTDVTPMPRYEPARSRLSS